MSDTDKKFDWDMRRIGWIDVETTGLIQPGRPLPLLLEVALIVTDGDLVELGRYSAVIAVPPEVLASKDLHPVVREMHETSGLLVDVANFRRATALAVAERHMVALIDEHAGDHPVIWGGFSPAALDRPLLSYEMPTLYRRLHHRTLDVSCLKLVGKSWLDIDPPEDLPEGAKHRALADTEESINVAKLYRTMLEHGAASAHKIALAR